MIYSAGVLPESQGIFHLFCDQHGGLASHACQFLRVRRSVAKPRQRGKFADCVCVSVCERRAWGVAVKSGTSRDYLDQVPATWFVRSPGGR